MRKAVITILLCTIIISTLTACWDSKEIDQWAYVYTIGIDKGVANTLRFTFQLPVLKNNGGGGSSGGGGGGGESGSGNLQSSHPKDLETITVDAPTLYTAVDMVETSLSRSLNYMHAKYLIISEDLAKSGVEGSINEMVRNRQIRRIMYIIVVKGKANMFIENFNPVFTGAFSKAQEGFMNQKNETGFIVDTSYNEFIQDMKSSYSMPITPLAALNNFSNFKESGKPIAPDQFVIGGKYTAGEVPREGGNKFEFLGTALFDGDKMVGELNGIQTRMLLMVRGEFERCAMSMQDPLVKTKRISIDTKQQREPKIKVMFQNGKPIINVKIFLEGDLQNVQSTYDYESLELKPLLESRFKSDMKKYLNQTIKICQNLNVDSFGFGEKVAHHFLTIQDWENYNWLSKFKDAKINTEFEFTIRRTGTLLKVNPTVNNKEKK